MFFKIVITKNGPPISYLLGFGIGLPGCGFFGSIAMVFPFKKGVRLLSLLFFLTGFFLTTTRHSILLDIKPGSVWPRLIYRIRCVYVSLGYSVGNGGFLYGLGLGAFSTLPE
jgi:hypothetical protein